jgi:hypothetical protein
MSEWSYVPLALCAQLVQYGQDVVSKVTSPQFWARTTRLAFATPHRHISNQIPTKKIVIYVGSFMVTSARHGLRTARNTNIKEVRRQRRQRRGAIKRDFFRFFRSFNFRTLFIYLPPALTPPCEWFHTLDIICQCLSKPRVSRFENLAVVRPTPALRTRTTHADDQKTGKYE